MYPAKPPKYLHRLRVREVEKAFTQVAIDVKEILVLDGIISEAAKRIAMARVRQDIAGIFPGCRFLLPTSIDKGSLVGIRFMGRTVFAEAPSHWEAYHELIRRAVEVLL